MPPTLLLHRAEPPGLRELPLAVGSWVPSGASSSLAILSYEEVRASEDPRRTLLAFCESAYEAGARLADWDVTAFRSSECPSADDLRATGICCRAVRASGSWNRCNPFVAHFHFHHSARPIRQAEAGRSTGAGAAAISSSSRPRSPSTPTQSSRRWMNM